MSGLSDNSAFETFGRMEEKINQLEAEADAQAEVAEQYTGDALSQRFRELETNRGTDMALEDLKRRMGMLPAVEAKPATNVRVSTAAPAEAAESEAEAEAAELERVLAEAEGRRQNQRS
jgi:phage shock protein A